MQQEKLPELLAGLAKSTVESVQPNLAERIKKRIPQKFGHHRGSRDTINIIIDLRINKLAAAAAIIIVMVLWAGLLGDQGSAGQLYQDSKLLVKYCFGGLGGDSGFRETLRLKYEYLVDHGKEVAYYGDKIDTKNSGAVLMHWKLSNNNYRVIFGDLHEKTVSAEELIKLQSRMIEGEF